MGAEDRAGARARQNLGVAVSVHIAAGDIDAELTGSVGHETHLLNRRSAQLESTDMGAEYGAGTGAGEDLSGTVLINISESHIGAVPVRLVGFEFRQQLVSRQGIEYPDIRCIASSRAGGRDQRYRVGGFAHAEIRVAP